MFFSIKKTKENSIPAAYNIKKKLNKIPSKDR